MDLMTMFTLSGLAGAFIALGALFFRVTVTDPTGGFGITRLVGGLAFSLGLVLVIVAGAELFTGNNLVAMAWASKLISGRELLRNWIVVYIGTAVGALVTVALVWAGKVDEFGGGEVGERALAIAESKAGLEIPEAIALGIMCNALVCLAVVANDGREDRDGQSAGDHLPHHRIRCHRFRALDPWQRFWPAGTSAPGFPRGLIRTKRGMRLRSSADGY